MTVVKYMPTVTADDGRYSRVSNKLIWEQSLQAMGRSLIQNTGAFQSDAQIKEQPSSRYDYKGYVQHEQY